MPKQKNADFAKRRDEVMAALNAIPGVRCPRPQGAFYAFPDISVAFGKKHGSTPINNDVDFCNALLESKGVACVPGSAFGEPRALRISYTCKPAELTDGLKRLQAFLRIEVIVAPVASPIAKVQGVWSMKSPSALCYWRCR